MARTPSTMLELGTPAPAFNLPSPLDQQNVSLANYKEKPVLVIFACNHCPYVLHILQPLADMITEYQSKGLATVMINSNDVANYPDDSPQKMVELSEQYQFSFPYLFDESQQAAKNYRAACTPDFFLFDDSHLLYYRGQFDSSRPSNNDPINGADLRAAIDSLLQDEQSPFDQQPSLGCNIKWKAGNEPNYF